MRKIPPARERVATPAELAEDRRRCLAARRTKPTPPPPEPEPARAHAPSLPDRVALQMRALLATANDNGARA